MYVCMYVLYQYAQVCFELSLRAGDFLVGHVVAEAHEVVQGVPHRIVQLVVGGHQVDAKETGVLRDKREN